MLQETESIYSYTQSGIGPGNYGNLPLELHPLQNVVWFGVRFQSVVLQGEKLTDPVSLRELVRQFVEEPRIHFGGHAL